jgi:hypothetical protein
LLKKYQAQLDVGVLKENDQVYFIRSSDEDVNSVWIEISSKEAEYYNKTGDRSFLKDDLLV